MDQAIKAEVPVSDPRELARKAWLERAEANFVAVGGFLQRPRLPIPEVLARPLEQMVEAAKAAECLDQRDRTVLAERVRGILVEIYSRSFEQAIDDARAAVRRKEIQAAGPLLALGMGYLGILRKNGVSQESVQRLKQKVQLVRETSPEGDSAKAKKDPPKDLRRAYANERRMFARWRDPVLHVRIAGKWYHSVDWCLAGFRLSAVEHLPGPVGSLLPVEMRVNGGRLHSETVLIRRYDEEKGELALQCRRLGAMIPLKVECEALGLEPN